MTLEPQDMDGAETTIEVWDVNWSAFIIFRACGTQWRAVATEQAIRYLGLDYAGVEVVMRQLLPADADGRVTFSDIQVMEAAALAIISEDPS